MGTTSISILGCGWLGLPLAQHLIEHGVFIKGSTTTKEKLSLLKQHSIEPFLIDLEVNDKDEYSRFLADSSVIIINIPPGRTSNVMKTYEAKINNVLPYIKSNQKVLFISSTSVYQNTNDEVSEALVVSPEKTSGKAILRVENLLRKSLKDRLTIIRFAGLVGYDRHPGRFLANRKGLANGDAPVNIIHRDDCIGLIETVLSKEVWGELFNGCADGHPSRKTYYTLAAKKIGLNPPNFIDGASTNYKIVSNMKSKKLLEYTYIYPDPLNLVS